MQRNRYEQFVLSLPHTTLVRQWRDDSVAKIGGKIFTLLDGDGGDIWFKASDMSFALLTELEGIRPAPYFARAKWVAVSAHCPLSDDDIMAYIEAAYRIIADKLPRKIKTELGLADAPRV
jgi:predicted DNA-binding protein (MmcQ/YjbR family)